MRNHLLHAFAILLTATVFYLGAGWANNHDAYAVVSQGSVPERDLTTVDEKGAPIRCAQIGEGKAGIVVGYIVPCVTYTIEGTTQRMSAEFMDMMTPAIFAFITLAVVLFGVRILQGGGQMHSEGLMLLLKIGIVLALIEMIPNVLVPSLYSVMENAQEVVAGAINPDTSSMKCDLDKFKTSDDMLIWAQMDCLLGKLYGITVGTGVDAEGNKQPNMLLGASVIGFMGGFLFGGSFGVILFLACIGILWTMLLIILRTASAFINAYLYASILFIVSPLFIPLILIRASAQYFEPWWKGILGSILLPIVISAYAMFAMMLYDEMLFSPNSLLKKLFNPQIAEAMQKVDRPACSLFHTNNPAQNAQITGVTEKQSFVKDMVVPFFSGENSCFNQHVTNIAASEIGTNTDRDAFTKMFYDCVKLFVIGLLINMGMTNITGLARKLVGSGGVVSTMDARGSIETQFAYMKSSVKQSVLEGLKDENGNSAKDAAFVAKIPGIPKSIGEGILAGIRRDV